MINIKATRVALVAIPVAILLAAATALSVNGGLPARGGAHDIDLQGVDGAELAGWGRVLQPDSRSPSLSAEAAVTAAAANKPDAQVLETVLVRVVNDGRKPPLDALAWAVNYDPATVLAVPPIGPFGAKLPRQCSIHPEYDVVFIDAQTGELIFELQHVATLPGDDPSATCPPKNYPSPTAVPGQPTAVR